MTLLPIGGTLKETIFHPPKGANWAVSSFPNAPFAILRSRGGSFRFSPAEFPALLCGWEGRAEAGPGQPRSPSGRGRRPRVGPAAEAAERCREQPATSQARPQSPPHHGQWRLAGLRGGRGGGGSEEVDSQAEQCPGRQADRDVAPAPGGHACFYLFRQR